MVQITQAFVRSSSFPFPWLRQHCQLPRGYLWGTTVWPTVEELTPGGDELMTMVRFRLKGE